MAGEARGGRARPGRGGRGAGLRCSVPETGFALWSASCSSEKDTQGPGTKTGHRGVALPLQTACRFGALGAAQPAMVPLLGRGRAGRARCQRPRRCWQRGGAEWLQGSPGVGPRKWTLHRGSPSPSGEQEEEAGGRCAGETSCPVWFPLAQGSENGSFLLDCDGFEFSVVLYSSA